VDLDFNNLVSVPKTYCLLQLKDGLCPSLRSLTLSCYRTVPPIPGLDPLLLLPDILRSRFLHSVMHYMEEHHGTTLKFHRVMLDHVDKGLLRTLKLSGCPPDRSYPSLSSFHNLRSLTLDRDRCNIEILNSLAPSKH
jgi:hypothetical protein